MGGFCHNRGGDGQFTDEQLVTHLITSPCSECADAGFRLQALLKEKQEQQSTPEVKGAKFAIELVVPIDCEGDWVELVGEEALHEDAVAMAHSVPVPPNTSSLRPAYVRMVYYGWSIEKALRPEYGHTWHSPTERYKPR